MSLMKVSKLLYLADREVVKQFCRFPATTPSSKPGATDSVPS